DVSRSQAEVNRLDGLYGEIVGILRYEHGLDNLADVQESNYRTTTFMGELVAFLMNEPDPEKVLDAIEVSFQVIARMTSSFPDRLRRCVNTVSHAASVMPEPMGRR